MGAANRLVGCAIVFGVWGGTVVGCAAFQSRPDKQQRELDRLNDDLNMERIERARAADASTFAEAVMHAVGAAGRLDRQKLSALVDEAVRRLEEERAAKPEAAAQLLAVEGWTQWWAARSDAAFQSVQESWSIRPTLPALILFGRLLIERRRRDEIVERCKEAREAGWLGDRLKVLDICFNYSGATSVEAGLLWASEKDVADYRVERERHIRNLEGLD